MKISIIVPVYNAGRFLEECLNSLLNQTHDDIEILCINDGSKDNSAEILDNFSKKDSRIKPFHQENKGPAAARNLGLENATGHYLMFCDADDTYEANMCEVMHKAITENDVDFAMCDANIIEFDENHGRDKGTIEYHHLKHDGKTVLTAWLKTKTNVLLWNKIFKLDTIRKNNICFPTGYECDDNSFIWQYLSYSKNFFGVNQKLYNYKLLSNSIMGGIFSGKRALKVFDRIYATEFTLKALGKDIVKNPWLLKVIENGLYFSLKHLSYRNRIKYLRLTRKIILPYYSYDEVKQFSLLKNLSKKKYRKVAMKVVQTTSFKLFGKVKKENETIRYFLGVPYLKESKGKSHDKTYIFGVRIRKKAKMYRLLLQKLEQLEHKLYFHNLYNVLQSPANVPDNERLTICFDCLYDAGQESIDAYSVFQYMQENGIPSKYVVLKGSALEKKLSKEKDIIVVNNRYELFNYIDILRKTKTVITSFGIWDDLNKLLKSIDYINYVYIDHGVILLKKWVLNLYNPKFYDKILVPTKLTYDLYKKNGVWSEKDMIIGGLPRWDKLEDKGNGTIFVFFTWRKSFEHKPKMAKKYIERIVNFIDKLSNAVGDDVQIEIAWHHELAHNYVKLPEINKKNVKIVSTSSISSAIQRSSILISDYSSVVWDYMCVDKPFVFYRFDKDELYLDEIDQLANIDAISEDEKLYNCFYDEESAISKVQEYVKNNFTLETKFKAQNKSIFFKQKNRRKDLISAIGSK